MPKYYKKKYYYPGSRDKYSVEQSIISGALTAGTTSVFQVVPPSDLQGMRKVKHLTINVCPHGPSFGFVWALFYLPAGMTPPGFNTTSGSPLVEPNQFVMNCGTFDTDAGPLRIHSPISRNLNSGDQIVLLARVVGSQSIDFSGIVKYAITLQ